MSLAYYPMACTIYVVRPRLCCYSMATSPVIKELYCARHGSKVSICSPGLIALNS